MPRQDQKIRTVIRMAVRLRERLAEFGQIMPLELPEANWQDCRRLARLAEKAITRGWFQAAARIRPQIVRALNELERSLRDAEVMSPIRPGTLVSLREFHAELAGLCAEFPTAECNLQRNAIRVVTEPVALEDVYLGAFLIELDLKSGESLNYSVLAIEPHPAANAEGITHPHVQGDRLCEGEGSPPIRRARRGTGFRLLSDRRPTPQHILCGKRLRQTGRVGRCLVHRLRCGGIQRGKPALLGQRGSPLRGVRHQLLELRLRFLSGFCGTMQHLR